ncbi:MAG: hypothetical protein PHF86_01520 [Candidatus Nanoarchaeia archaeon]|nr:hypothetical protein [Candidatus Nanoarchaeia archaeon]
MSQRNVLILERSSQNLQKIAKDGKVILEGVFAEFGIENRNGRIYEEKEYLPHLEYLKKDIDNGNLLGELDHPERFEVALGSVSHRISELWYDQEKRQILGRIEVLNTPKGLIAKSLLEAGIPLSISSRAAGTVNEDKTVQIQQIYTYDLVAKPGFPNAQLDTVNEGAQARIKKQIAMLNESANKYASHNISKEFGIINENVTIVDLTDKFPALKLREEAIALQIPENVKNKNEVNKMEKEKVQMNEDAIQQWTIFFKNELSKMNSKLTALENSILEGSSSTTPKEKDLNVIKQYVEKLRKIQEDTINWQTNIAKAVNKLASHAEVLVEKNNQHYNLTKKIAETVDYNAKALNATQDWIGNNAQVINAIGETVDHNADMLNGINEWNEELSQAVNALHEWGGEKAKAINGMHDWTSSIAKNVNEMANWSEDMFGRAMSKSDAKKLIEYIELVSESKQNPELKAKLEETLSKHGISDKPLNETMITGIKGVKGLGVITDVPKVGNVKVDTNAGKQTGVTFDGKTIVSKIKNTKVSASGSKPKGLKTIEDQKETSGKITTSKVKGIMTLSTVKGKTQPVVKISGNGPKSLKDQNMKLDTKPECKLKEAAEIKERASKLDEKLGLIISNIEKEKKLVENAKSQFPFITLLNESDKKAFAELSDSDKQKVATEIAKHPTTDSKVIKGLWESALIVENKVEEPLWLKIAPKAYRDLYDKAPEALKEAIKARSEFYPLETQYQINNFWETSKLAPRTVTLNEVFLAKEPKEGEKKLDSFVASIGEQMKKYQR